MVGVPSSRSRFQSTLPLRGATHANVAVDHGILISIHTPLAGSDLAKEVAGARTVEISIHTPLAGSDVDLCVPAAVLDISIHTPLAGSDSPARRPGVPYGISIHTPLAGSDEDRCRDDRKSAQFQSTLPLRGATKERDEKATEA